MSKQSRWATGLTVAAGASAALPTTALALEPYAGLGAFVSYTFEADQPWGVGLEMRAGATGGHPFEECGGSERAYYYGGGALRFEWFPESHSRLLLVAQGGRGVAVIGTHAEVGLGYRFGLDEGLETLIGAELTVIVGALALRVEPIRGEFTPALGVVFSSVVLPATTGCSSVGRPLRAGDGYAPLPPLSISEADTRRQCRNVPAEVVRQWGTRAQTELASVPAFRELAEQLHLLGAPAELIARCHDAARDELHHAMLAANHCAVLGDRRVQLQADGLKARPTIAGPQGMVRLAVESWVDGCLGEGVAAACAAEEARLAMEHDVRRWQLVIARDEARHADLAWDVLRWTLDAGGSEVRDALHAAAEARPSGTRTQIMDETFEPFGILSTERERAISEIHRQRSLSRLHEALSAA